MVVEVSTIIVVVLPYLKHHMSFADMALDLQEPYTYAKQYQKINASEGWRRGKIIICCFKILNSQNTVLKTNFGEALCSYIYI